MENKKNESQSPLSNREGIQRKGKKENNYADPTYDHSPVIQRSFIGNGRMK
jgi:hypothetical protein